MHGHEIKVYQVAFPFQHVTQGGNCCARLVAVSLFPFASLYDYVYARVHSLVSYAYRVAPVFHPYVYGYSGTSVTIHGLSTSDSPGPSSVGESSAFELLLSESRDPDTGTERVEGSSPPRERWAMHASSRVSRSVAYGTDIPSAY